MEALGVNVKKEITSRKAMAADVSRSVMMVNWWCTWVIKRYHHHVQINVVYVVGCLLWCRMSVTKQIFFPLVSWIFIFGDRNLMIKGTISNRNFQSSLFPPKPQDCTFRENSTVIIYLYNNKREMILCCWELILVTNINSNQCF